LVRVESRGDLAGRRPDDRLQPGPGDFAPGWPDPGNTGEISTRGMNILIGLMALGFANISAKRLGPLV
jgi:hypothetical protein